MIKKLHKSNNFWTIVIGIIGFGIAVLLYLYSIKDREPLYAVKKEPSIIFDKENSTSKIKLLSNDSIIINDNVYVTTIVIWNNGELEIKKSDLRKEFVISISDQSKILDYKIINQTKPEISKFKIIPKNNHLKLDWDYFDPYFGVELQVIYSGTEKSELLVNGYVLGKEIKKVTPRESLSKFMIFMSCVLLFQLILFLKKIINELKEPKKDIISLIFLGIFIIFICVILYYNFLAGTDLPL